MAESTLKEKTAKGLFWGGIGNGVQQVLTLAIGIFLARQLGAGDYGIIGMITIFTAVAAVIQDGGFAAALINKQNATQADYNAVFWFNVTVGVVIYITAFFCAPFIASFYHTPELVALTRYVFISFMVGCLGSVSTAILMKRLIVKQRMIINIIAIFISGVIGVTMAYHGMAYWGLATQTLAFNVIMVSSYIYIARWHPTFQFSVKPLKEMLPFSIKIAATNIFNAINQNILATLLGRFFNRQQVGYYTQGNKWMLMGSSFVSSMVNGVAQPVLATAADERDRQCNIFRKMLRFIAFVAFPCMLGLALVSRELIVITITAKWMQSVLIMQLLCIWGAIIPINNLYSNMVVSRGKSNIFLWMTISLGIAQLIALISTYRFGITTMIITFIAINICGLLAWSLIAKRQIGLRVIDALMDVLPFLGAALVAIAAAFFASRGIASLWLSLIIKIVAAVVVYVVVMRLSGSVIFKESVAFLYSKIKRQK